jgi:hypothetical protein
MMAAETKCNVANSDYKFSLCNLSVGPLLQNYTLINLFSDSASYSVVILIGTLKKVNTNAVTIQN